MSGPLDPIEPNQVGKLDDLPQSAPGQPGGLAGPLDESGYLPSAQIPPIALTNTFVVADQAARLALPANVGDVAIQADNNTNYILQTLPATVNGNWIALATTPYTTSTSGGAGNAGKLLALDADGKADGSDLPAVSALATGAIQKSVGSAADQVLVFSGSSTPAVVTLTANTALAKRSGSAVANAIGVASPTDLLDRAGGDGRYIPLAGSTSVAGPITDTLGSTDSIILDGLTHQRPGGAGGILQVRQKPSGSGSYGIHVTTDANGTGGTHCIAADYTATGLAANQHDALVHLQIDKANSSGGEVCGVVVSALNSGSANAYGLCTDPTVSAIRQVSATLGNIGQAWLLSGAVYTDVTASFNGGGGVTLWGAAFDYVYIGAASPFALIEFVFSAVASASLRLAWTFSTGSGFAPLVPVDGTNNGQENGNVRWIPPGAWAARAVNGVSMYYIAIQRLQSGPTAPVESIVKIAANYSVNTWDASGNVSINQLTSTVTTGTPPLVVASTTQVANLNASSVAGKAPASASGLATLDGSSLVVQNPANATQTPTASKIPIANSGNAQLAQGWLASGTASAGYAPLADGSGGTAWGATGGPTRTTPTGALLAYQLNDAAGSTTVVNTGSASSCDLSAVGTTPTLGAIGPYSDCCAFISHGTASRWTGGANSNAKVAGVNFTMSIWVKIQAINIGGWGQIFIAQHNDVTWGDGNQDVGLVYNNGGTGRIDFVLTANTGKVTVNSADIYLLTPGVWHHIGLTWDGSTLRGYVDGALAASGACVGTSINWGTGSWSIGNFVGDTDQFAGWVQDAWWFASTQPASWFASVYRAGRSV